MREAIQSAKLVFAPESWPEFWRDSQDALKVHWQEIAKDKDLMRLNVNETYYSEAYATGHLLVVTARDRGRLAGYTLWTLHEHPHYQHVICAQDDVHFLLPEYRRGMNGYLLLKNAMRIAKLRGAHYCYVREKDGHEHPAMIKRLGLTKLDITYSCNLTTWSAR